MADLGKFNRYYKEYIGNSELVHALHRFSRPDQLDGPLRNEMLRNMEAHYKIGGAVRFKKEDVEKYIDSCKA